MCPAGFNKELSLKFHKGSRVRQTPEEDQRTYWPKYCGNNNKDEDNSPKTLNDNNLKQLFNEVEPFKISQFLKKSDFTQKYNPKIINNININIYIPTLCIT